MNRTLKMLFLLLFVSSVPFDVITELTFDDEEGLNQFFAKGADEEVVEAIRQDESNFLDGKKTIMYRVD